MSAPSITRPAWELRRGMARELAQHTLDETWDGQIPVDPIAIANRYGIECIEKTLPPRVSGKLEVNGERPKIYVAWKESANRARFTIAHELGHYRFDPTTDRTDFRDGRSNLEEYGANEFAAALLMPEQNFRKDACCMSTGELAQKYAVSVMAATVRKKTLEIDEGSLERAGC